MNKIEVKSKNEIINDLGNKVDIKVLNDTLNITVTDDVEDSILLVNDIYENIIINISDNKNVSFLEISNSNVLSNRNYKYVIGAYSRAVINKFYYMNEYSENITANLDGLASDLLFNLSTLSTENQKYHIAINHNNKRTVSNIYNHGVTYKEGTLDFTIDGIVKKGMSDSVLNQDNKIMTMGNGKSVIKPNLFIDENMVEARHGASIGRFNDDEIFYLEARGIPESVGYQLLLKGFLLGNINVNDDIKKELSEIVEKFGR